ncbi:MAG TPA: hypothetical protein VLM91_18750 [Candidatus Methylomirabilis sp.]|nr:hypothetical protein [Candidatus Methylomirabilis sp.]
MRKIIPVALVLALVLIRATSAAPSLGPDSPWSDIRSTPNVLAKPPLIFFGSTGVPVTDVCTAGGSFRAVNRNHIASEVPVGMRPLIYEIEVVEIFGNGDHPHTRLLFLKHLDIPACT